MKRWQAGLGAFLVAVSAHAIQTAGDLLININVSDLAGKANGETVGYWPNAGTLGSYFTNMVPGKGPLYSASVGGVPAVTFQAYNADSVMTNLVAVPASICGTDTWSFETWVFNPSLSQTEIAFSWTARNAWPVANTGSCFEFRYGGDAGNAIEHYGNNVSWATGPLTAIVPPVGAWHHVVATRDAEGRERLYVDGQQRTLTTPLVMRIRTDGMFTLGATRDYAATNTATASWNSPFSGSLAKVRVHDGTLSAGDVVANYLEERGAFGVTQAPDSIWNGASGVALPWEDSANWAGGLPTDAKRVFIANGGTSVVSTAVGEVGRFLPYHGGLILSNNASLVAPPWEAQHVYMGNYSNNIFTLWIKEGRFAMPDYTNGHHLYFGANRGQAYGVVGGGTAPAILDAGRDLQIGANDGTVARMTVEAGGELCTSNATIYVGVSGMANAKLTVNGGYVGHRRLPLSGLDLIVGHNNSYGVLEINDGLVAPSQDLRLTGSAGSVPSMATAIAQLNGGLLWTRRIYPENTAGTNILFLNGGTIRNRDTRNDFIYNLDWAYVQPGGAKFDILESTAVMASQPLLSDPNLGDGGLTKSGNGTLTLSGANTFTGNVTVTAGHLCFSNAAGLVSGYAGKISASAGASVGYATAGGVATLLGRMDTASAGGITLYPVNAAENVDLSAFPSLSLGFAGSFTYTGTYTPYNNVYRFAPVSAGNVYSAQVTDGAGTASVVCDGMPAGVIELTGDNSFTGGATINGGILSMGHVNALGTSGTILIKRGAALRLNAAGITAAIVSRIDAASEGSILLGTPCAALSLDLTGLPDVHVGTDVAGTTMTASGTITPENDTYRLGGGRLSHVSGNYGLIVQNLSDNGATPRTVVIDEPGLICPSNATHSGGTVVTNNGILHLRWDHGLGAVPASADPLNLYVNGGVLRPGQTTFTLNANRGITVGPEGMILHPWGSQTFTVNGSLHGSGAITNTDGGTVWLGGANNSWSGTAMINSGIVGLGNGSTFSWNPAAKLGGNGGTVGVNYNGDLTWSSQIGASLGDGSWPNVQLRKYGTGTLTVDVPQSYWGTTTIDNGTLKAGTPAAVPNGYGRGNVQLNNLNYNPIGRLDVNGLELNINGLSGAGAITNSTSTATQILVNNNNQNSTYYGPVAANVALTKIGSGTLTLQKGARLADLNVKSGVVAHGPDAAAAGAVTVSANATLTIGANANELNGLLGEYFDFSNTALRPYASVATLASLETLNSTLAPFAAATVVCSGPVSNVFSFGSNGALFQNKGDYRVARWTGKFLAETDGVYNFDSASDDGSMVFVKDVMVVSNNFSQGYGRNGARKLAPISLKAGWHDIVVAYYNGTGSYGLTVFMTPPGGTESELPQRLLRPPAAQLGALTGTSTANTSFLSANAAAVLSPTGDAVYDGLFTGTNWLMSIDKSGAGSQTLKRAAFQGSSVIKQGTLALQNSGVFGGAVQILNDTMSISNGAAFHVRSYDPAWPNAGLLGLYYNTANYSATGNQWLNSLNAITNQYTRRTPDLVMGTWQAGANFRYNPNSLFPPPYNSGSFNDFQALYQGKLIIREAGSYAFRLVSDDRSDLYINGVQVIADARDKTSTTNLAAGSHDMFVPFQQGGGGYAIYMTWTPPGGTAVDLPNSVLRPCSAQVGALTGEGGSSVSLENTASYLRVNQTAPTTMAGAFDGPYASEVEKTGPATLTLAGDNDAFLGSWFVSQGELWAGDGATGGTLGGSNVYVSGGAALVFNRSDDITYAGALAGKGEIRSAGTGKVKLTGNAANFQGAITVGAGQSITMTRSTVSTNALVNNGGTFGISGPQAFFSGSRISGSGETRLSEGGTLSLGAQDVNFPNTLAVSNGVLALAVTNANSAWQISRLTLDAGTTLDVIPSGVWGKYYDIAYNVATVSNAFSTYASATNYFAGLTPTLVVSTCERGDVFDFGRSDIGGTFFPGKYKTAAANFAAQYVGKIRITEPGTYTFGVTSDDNGIIYIDGQEVANGNYNKGMTLRTGTVTLTAGLHDFALFYAQGTGGWGLYADVTLPGQTASQRLPNSMLVAALADTPAYTVTVDTIAVTNGPGVGTVTLAGQGTLKLTDLWIDTGAKLAVTGAVACAGSTLTVAVPEELPRGVTYVGDFTATAGLDVSGVTLTAEGTDGRLLYREKQLYISRPSGTVIHLR